MSRVAWLSPLPPTRSGIADYSAEVLPHLAASYDIDLYTWPPAGVDQQAPADRPVFSAHDFPWKQFRAPYDL